MRHRPHCLRRGGAVVSCIPCPCERACGTPGARCTLGPDANAVFRRLVCIRTFGGAERLPGVPHAVFFRLLALCLDERSDRELKSQGDGKGASSDWAERVLTWSSVTLSRGLSIRRSAVSLPVAVLAQIRPARRQTFPHEPRDAASPASTASHPANVTIAIAPLGGAGRRGI